MIIKTKVESPPGELFAPGCFDENIGMVLPVLINDDDYVGRGTVLKAEVAEDMSHVLIIFEVPDLTSDTLDLDQVHLSTDLGPGYTGDAEEIISA